MNKRMTALVLALVLMMTGLSWAMAEDLQDIERPPVFTDWPQTDEQGYLQPGVVAGDEFLHEDAEQGVWIYLSPTLRVEVNRLKAKTKHGKLIWLEAEVKSREAVFRAYSDNPDRPRAGLEYPQLIARKHRVVLGISGDYFNFRIGSKIPLGVIVRNGKTISSHTYAQRVQGQPPLDELSLYADGRMEVRHPREMSSQEYLERGALDVLAFGPILLRDGEVDDRLFKRFQGQEPRVSVGMIEPGHYIAITVEGRHKRSVGADCLFMAQRMKALGTTTAFTLDGGQTTCMVFMGTVINEPGEFNGAKFVRKQPDILGIGLSELVRTDKKR